MQTMQGMKRTHYCGHLTADHIGTTVTVMGWVNKRRDFNKLIFIVLRDKTGLIQLVTDETGKAVRGEYVVAATGVVVARAPENVNPDMPTGAVELNVTELRILSEADTPPFQVADTDVGMDLRLKHRYLDLRRPEMQAVLQLRHRLAQTTRRYLTDAGCTEVETPTLTKSTPEGARDYLVASRMHPGQFYALPQSPQLFKQMLMIAGLDRYFQITKCYRDEDLRADRQPEFTQIDIELSFVDAEDVFALNEGLLATLFREVLGRELPTPFPRLTYREAMERFGVDKPDLRFGIELCDLTHRTRDCEFAIFRDAESVRGIVAPGMAALPRKQIDALVDLAKTHKAKGLAWITLSETGEPKTTLSKFFSPEQLAEMVADCAAKPGDLILICADKTNVVFDALGALRLDIARRAGLLDKVEFRPVWITEFPLLEYSEEDDRYYARHHPFTAPMDEDVAALQEGRDLAAIRAKAYDLVLNGFEVCGGSLRIFQRDLQALMFRTLGFSPEEAEAQFGFFLEALRYGTPPHGGSAWGLDRLVMLFAGADSLREVIAFPKVKDASCPLTDAPSPVAPAQLNELGIAVNA